MKTIWAEFYDNRNGVKPKIIRRIPLEKLLSLIQEIYDHRWTYEETKSETSFRLEDDADDAVPSRFEVRYV